MVVSCFEASATWAAALQGGAHRLFCALLVWAERDSAMVACFVDCAQHRCSRAGCGRANGLRCGFFAVFLRFFALVSEEAGRPCDGC